MRESGYKVIGPTIHNGAIVYSEIFSSSDLPQSYTDIQKPGFYRLDKTNEPLYFNYVVGPQS